MLVGFVPLLPISQKREVEEKKKAPSSDKEHEAEPLQNINTDSAKAKKKSRIETKSISKVVAKLHFSYIAAIMLLIIAFVVVFVVSNFVIYENYYLISWKAEWNSFVAMNDVSKNIHKASLRAQYFRNILYDISIYAYYPVSIPLLKKNNF